MVVLRIPPSSCWGQRGAVALCKPLLLGQPSGQYGEGLPQPSTLSSSPSSSSTGGSRVSLCHPQTLYTPVKALLRWLWHLVSAPDSNSSESHLHFLTEGQVVPPPGSLHLPVPLSFPSPRDSTPLSLRPYKSSPPAFNFVLFPATACTARAPTWQQSFLRVLRHPRCGDARICTR